MNVMTRYDTSKVYQDDPDMLYHFTKAENACKILLEGRLNFSTLYRADDIKEYKLHTFVKQDFHHLTNNAVKDFILNKCKSICFSSNYISKNRNVEGIDLPRMWAQYADNWKGVCIVLSKNAILENNKFIDEDFFCNVSYVDHFCDYDTINDTDKESVYKYIRRERQRLFFEKHSDWASEHEVKLIHFGEEKSIDISKCIEYICFGNKFLESGFYDAMSEVLHLKKESPMQTEIQTNNGDIVVVQMDFSEYRRRLDQAGIVQQGTRPEGHRAGERQGDSEGNGLYQANGDNVKFYI